MSIKFKAGKYYVGDLCYVINDKNWDELIKKTSCFSEESFEFKGKEVFVAGTAYGDGTYYDNNGREYSVDAGLIGVIPFEIIDNNEEGDGGQIIDFTNDFIAYEDDGKFYIDNFIIDTKEDDEEYDEEYDEDYEEEPTEENYFNYLDDLRESGETNMFGARPYLMRKFPNLSEQEAKTVFGKWMNSFSE